MVIEQAASAFIGAIVGSLGTYMVSKKLESEREQEEISQLRKGLSSELDNQPALDAWEPGDPIPGHKIVTTEFYSSNCDKISTLPEVSDIVEYYSWAIVVQGSIEYVRFNNIEQNSEMYGSLCNQIEELQEKKSDLKEKLNNNI